MRSILIQLILVTEVEKNLSGSLEGKLKVYKVIKELAHTIEDYILGKRLRDS